MHPLVKKYADFGLKPAFEPTETMVRDATEIMEMAPRVSDSLITIPGLPNYLPPMIPDDPNWLEQAQAAVNLSFRHLVADIWTQLLTLKRDAKEKPLYLLWDADVPKPNHMSALAWLLICETWPMVSHRESAGKGTAIFPAQSFVLPQGTPLGFAGSQPYGYARRVNSFILGRSLNSLFVESLARHDREAMALMESHHAVYRPRASDSTGYGFHAIKGYEREYSMQWVWPRTTNVRADYGFAAYELQESDHHHKQVEKLRALVMNGVSPVPGMPTHRDNLHNVVGGSIRGFSEEGIQTLYDTGNSRLPWSTDGDSIKLEHGVTLKSVPLHAPRIWFGFSKLGIDSHANAWAEAYCKYRQAGLIQLMMPELPTTSDVEQATERRGQALKRAGRIKSTIAAAKANDFAAAFNAVMNQEKK